MKLTLFARFAWAVLGGNLLVILWGAFVRATGSGAGCGSHWPLCNGEWVPRAPALETLVELSHRLTAGLVVLATAGLLVWAWRIYPKGHMVRSGAVASLFFLLMEALIGAGLVLLEYVADNVSLARAYWMAGHLVNTFFLLAALVLTAWWASGGVVARLRGQGALAGWLGAALIGMLILGADGGVTALGDTLVFTAGIAPSESAIVAGLVSLRIYHPLLAVIVGGLVTLAAWMARVARPSPVVQRLSGWLIAFFVGQLLLGALNVALHAPVWIQLTHLLLADLIWIGLILLTVETLAQHSASAPVATNRLVQVSK
jgi:heme A synthase